MRTETIVRTIYSARELKESNPKGFERAHERYRQETYDDPAWVSEYRESLDKALEAFGPEPPDDTTIDSPRRSMSWIENNILRFLRLPFAPIKERKAKARYGSFYRPGCIEPCPWTGFCADDDILDFIIAKARRGESPAWIKRNLPVLVDRLASDDVEGQASEEGFLEAADANGWEFTAGGGQV